MHASCHNPPCKDRHRERHGERRLSARLLCRREALEGHEHTAAAARKRTDPIGLAVPPHELDGADRIVAGTRNLQQRRSPTAQT
jgi:hypothetical protein